jgi:hypothetical protein
MADPVTSGQLDELDGLNATRALILQAYYALRRRVVARQIGTREIAGWIERHEREETMPSDALIQLTLTEAKVPHRLPGRPRAETSVAVLASPFLLSNQVPPPGRQQR